MQYQIRTTCDPCTLKVVFQAEEVARTLSSPTMLVQVYDAVQPNTVLANREIPVQAGQQHTCYIPLPVAPWQSTVRIVETQPETVPKYRVLEIRKMGLSTFRHAIDWRSPEVGQAIALGNRFCYNLGILDTLSRDRAYCSPDGSLKIKYLPVLDNPETGQESATPMRISSETAIMEASQKKCVPFTVPGRAVMFFHEFAHKFENQHPDWELEADLNGLTIYLALGYSRYEALQVYRTVFHNVDTPENRDRMAHIADFINNFERLIKHQK